MLNRVAAVLGVLCVSGCSLGPPLPPPAPTYATADLERIANAVAGKWCAENGHKMDIQRRSGGQLSIYGEAADGLSGESLATITMIAGNVFETWTSLPGGAGVIRRELIGNDELKMVEYKRVKSDGSSTQYPLKNKPVHRRC